MSLRCVVLFVCVVLPVVARAGAFMQPPDHGQVIAQLAFSQARFGYDSLARPVAIPAWRKFELSTYAEYGLADWVTLIGEPSWFTFRAASPGRNATALGATEAGARVRVFEWQDNVISAQVTGRYATGGRLAEAYADMGRRAQVDVRLLYGRNIEMAGMPGYVDTQIAFRSHGPFGNQVRFDVTWALRPFSRTTLMLQSFTAITPGRLGLRFALLQKMQASVLYDVTDAISLQFGALVALRGVNAAAERGLVSGLWWRF
jgi:protein XagA